MPRGYEGSLGWGSGANGPEEIAPPRPTAKTCKIVVLRGAAISSSGQVARACLTS